MRNLILIITLNVLFLNIGSTQEVVLESLSSYRFSEKTLTLSSFDKEIVKDSITIEAGATLAPQIKISFDERPKQTGAPILGIITIYNSKWFVAPFYNFASDDVGILISRTLIKDKLSIYYFGTKKFDQKVYYSGIGVTTPLGKALGFLEFGGLYGREVEDEKGIFGTTGILIPFRTMLGKY